MTLQPEQTSISSTCAYCGVGCGVDIGLDNGKPISLEGMREHPANFGRLCVKGTHLLDTTGTDKRLTTPLVDGKPSSWSHAIKKVATSLQDVIQKHGKDAVAFYVSGQFLTEDYYVANKLMKGYIGSANIDTNSRLCMSSAVSAYKRAFGEDVVPCEYTDIDHSDVFVLVGSNAAWTHPVLFQRAQRVKKQRPNMKIVVIDPRKTATAEAADLHLQLRPGSDAALFNGLLNFAQQQQVLDIEFIKQHTHNFEACIEQCKIWSVDKVASFCELESQDIIEFYRYFCENQKVLSFYSMGINQSSSGVDKCNSIINCHLAMGKLLYKGAGPFSITGQPNAMGGREVGGLANQLAAHLDIENKQHQQIVQKFWQSPNIANKAGHNAVDMFKAVKEGKIKAIWIMATNPMVSLPNRTVIKEALESCECVIVSDCVSKNDTLAYADIALPATGWIEKDGTVTNSERTISRQRGVVEGFGQAKHDWQIICEVAQAMGYEGFEFTSPHQIFNEWTQMTKAVNHTDDGIKRQLDLTPLIGLSEDQYNQLSPQRWPFNKDGSSATVFKNKHFSTLNKRANFIAVSPRLPQQIISEAFPLLLNSGRMRDQWHTMTRTSRAHALNQHSQFPSIDIHPVQATKLGIKNGEIVQLDSLFGYVQAYASVSDSVRKTECFMPIHWNEQFASKANVSSLYSSVVDPLSGQPESKQVAVKVSKTNYQQFISVFSKDSHSFESDFWLRSKRSSCEHLELANKEFAPLEDMIQEQKLGEGEWLCKSSAQTQIKLLIEDGNLIFAAFSFYSQEQQQKLASNWVNSCFDQTLDSAQISALFEIKVPQAFTQGKLICSCFKVHEKTIIEAISQGCDSVDALGAKLKCGTNCGSCKSELTQLINSNMTVDNNKHLASDKNKIEVDTI